jgi:uncharacterized protein YybS (DUF2232 family)
MEKKVMSHIQKGLLIGLVGVVLGVIGYMAHIEQESWFTWTSTLITCILIIWACVYYAQQLDGRVTFGNVFAHGFKTSVVITLVTIVYFVLAITILFPEMKDKAMENARQKMEQGGKMSEEQITQAIDMTKKFFMPFAIGAILLGTLIFGAIASLIGAAVAKKKPINPLDQLPA